MPYGGMFLWLTFPKITSSSEDLFQELAATSKVVCVSGDSFYVHDADGLVIRMKNESGDIADTLRYNGPPCIRLCYASATPERIREVIQWLGNAVKKLSQ